MINFPEVPKWWKDSNKFMHMETSFDGPDWVIGYDTETCNGHILTQQFYQTRYGQKQRIHELQWVNDNTVLDEFLKYMSSKKGIVIVYCFNAKFDLAILLRKYITQFLGDDFETYYKHWKIQVFCSRNWYAYFSSEHVQVKFYDIQNFFSGSLDSVGQTFNLRSKKLKHPEGLGTKLYTKKDKVFIEYALRDAEMCLEIGEHILDMHKEFDIPFATSSANFAEKVFRRKFLIDNMRISFPEDFECLRMSEESYHGGKNGYYYPTPLLVEKCYEYDFNSAYPSAMYSLPSFVGGRFQKISFFSDKYVGIYKVTGKIQPCNYGIMYDQYFNYFRYSDSQMIESTVTSFELEEALKKKEFKIGKISGWIWKPDSESDNPIREYAKYFWEKKNTTSKNNVRYLFYKLLLNSLYGKWIQRNPSTPARYTYSKNELSFLQTKDVSGGLYQPFIASLITGFVRSRLHKAEHYFDAIESSTDSVKSRKYVKQHDGLSRLGAMQLEYHKCKVCEKSTKSFSGLFIRNRLNLLMDNKKHILKAALHGFWGKADELYKMYKEGRVWYTINKMSGIREGLKQQGKPLFEMYQEERSLNIDWTRLKKL